MHFLLAFHNSLTSQVSNVEGGKHFLPLPLADFSDLSGFEGFFGTVITSDIDSHK